MWYGSGWRLAHAAWLVWWELVRLVSGVCILWVGQHGLRFGFCAFACYWLGFDVVVLMVFVGISKIRLE
jgi:hypothetical protein